MNRKVLIAAGASWNDSFVSLRTPILYRDVTSVERGLPTKFTVPSHGLPLGKSIPIKVANSTTLRLNTEPDAYHFATVQDADTLVLHGVNTTTKDEPTMPVRVSYLTPVDWSGATARIQFKTAIDAPTLVTLTETSGVVINGPAVAINLTPEQSRTLVGEALDIVTGFAQLELTLGGVTERIVEYNWVALPEWTTEEVTP